MGLEDCVIYLRDEDKGVWVQKAAYGPKNVDYRAIHEPMELAFGQGIVGRGWRLGHCRNRVQHSGGTPTTWWTMPCAAVKSLCPSCAMAR